jgi:hypothetical protein
VVKFFLLVVLAVGLAVAGAGAGVGAGYLNDDVVLRAGMVQ